MGRTLVVTGFPEGVTKKQFYKCCRKFGEVEQLDYPIEGRFTVLVANTRIHTHTHTHTHVCAYTLTCAYTHLVITS